MTERLNVDAWLAVDVFKIDKEKHIVVNQDICRQKCSQRYCLYVCPGNLYSWEEGEIHLKYEGCLECGTCRLACVEGALEWNYPRGGFGVQYRFG